MEHHHAGNANAVEDRYAGYTVYDSAGSKIGKVDDLFLDENDSPEYIGVKMGFLGTSSTLIPMEMATTDESAGTITVSTDKETVKNGPSFDNDREITPEYENEVRSYYGLRTGEGATLLSGSKELDRLLDTWMADESGYDEETWPELKRALDRNRVESGDRRKLFVD